MTGTTSLKEGRWTTLRVDLLPHIKDGLPGGGQEDTCRAPIRRNMVASMNLGWEMPGTFDAAIQVRNLRVLALPADNMRAAVRGWGD